MLRQWPLCIVAMFCFINHAPFCPPFCPPKVLASAEVVSRCAPGALYATAQASSMGAFKLKGVPEPVEVYAVK